MVQHSAGLVSVVEDIALKPVMLADYSNLDESLQTVEFQQ